ncbi:IucA/IucC family protein [Sinomicrobium weinanense]|uniref:IucA/IucC family siderophore biosynthesis protein n=1 Tax=Sinomicrobium weinanense TaxID=2842200 RepID=A0A926JNP2_9FLAO|nr:IucA/IucC family siderophore biosynthesis protein [Sinomicrobium weinanense]MBC9794519.1 IucA/IucC family siderophore biosynthesis protein [Sinomicrobium weinanense]MBU3124426.1 IucA/IucC family siderophore biosynthesis protein [Sinomicrobium weinanense]
MITETLSPREAVSHITPVIWARVNRLHLCKVISEFAHENIIIPEKQYENEGWGHYVLHAFSFNVQYRFRAKIGSLNHWYIDRDSLEKYTEGKPDRLDSLRFVVEFREAMGIDEQSLPVYMEEVSSTLCGSAYMHMQSTVRSGDLIHAGYQEIERAMTGHPRFIANNGRIGFDTADYRDYAPEAASAFSLIWVAGHRERTVFTSIEPLTYQQLLLQELGEELLGLFRGLLTKKGLDPDEYIFIQVHPWQWYNKLAIVFASDIAAGRLVYLGPGKDEYLPQQSIRTFFNVSNPDKFYVKTALSILNMGYVRGLSPGFMQTNPPVSKWVEELVEGDSYLRETGFCVLREIAGAGYTNMNCERSTRENSPYKKMLSCLWRESPLPKMKKGQRLMTMAALLHTDTEGAAFLPELIRASGLDTDPWIRQYLHCYMSPLLHCFYRYDLVFMPHGENLILVMEDHVPVRAIMKDLGEEVSVMNKGAGLPEEIRRIAVEVSDGERVRPIFTQLFDSIFRFIAAILHEHAGYPEERFWELIAECIHNYGLAHPQLEEKIRKYDLFVPEISPDALNRLQLRNNRQLRNRATPFNVKYIENVANPVARFEK